MPELDLESPRFTAVASISLRIIAAVIVVFALYYASSIMITLICSMLIAFMLEPGVQSLERVRVARWLGALIMVLLALAAVYVAGYLVYGRLEALAAQLPVLAERLQQIATHVESALRGFGASILGPPNPQNTAVPVVRVQQESPWADFLWRGIGSVYSFTVTVMFIPFLVFFMLTSKNHIWAATLNLFPITERQQAEDVIDGMAAMVRRYVLGNLLVALISAVVMTPVFAWIGLRYALVLGPIAALLSLIPYIGVALAIIPPLLIALLQFNRVGPFIGIAVTVMAVHFIAVNFLTPKLVGHRVHLNALSVTLGMMFWGWLWGAIGLVLAVPLMAAIKAVCDNVHCLKPVGTWMGED